jgi:type III restriction enzyme
VVIWFSDDPSLNDQTRLRLIEASDKLLHSDLVTIAPPFSRPRLDPGKVYFLNTGKLTKSSLLTRGQDPDADSELLPGLGVGAQPDLQGWTIWETIASTINEDDLMVYLILDEAHRGFNAKANSDKPTIVRRLVDGHAGYPPIPIVWGISATIERFRDAMSAANADRSRKALEMVSVDGFRVQESGLVKDTVVLEIPDEAGNFDSVLVRRAAGKLRASTERWQRYAESQRTLDVVRPLLVLQAPNTPNPDDLGMALDTIFAEYPELQGNAVRHVLGEHTTQKFGTWEVDHIEPQLVEDSTQVRVLIAKDAISTGWDCPRAEVLVSFRPARDHTHITQLLGRMVRSPLARRIPGDEKLNSVECILPFFDRTTAGNVVKFLTGQIDGVPDPSNRKVIRQECLLLPNPNIPDEVWASWDRLPTETIPKRGASPVKRLSLLALALSQDELRPGALAEVGARLHGLLDEARTTYAREMEKAVQEVWDVHLQAIAGRIGRPGAKLTYTDFLERADDRAIRVAFEDARKAFGPDVAQSYVNHLADSDDSGDDSLREAFVATAALATVREVRDLIDRESDELAADRFAEYSDRIRELVDLRRADYDEIRALATTPQIALLGRPRTRIEDYLDDREDGQAFLAELMPKHLMADESGMCPVAKLNEWELEVVKRELARPDSVGWYRNPPRQTSDSLGVAYRDEVANWRSMHPDFIFFNRIDGVVRASIVDPHGHHLEDSMVKLQGLARFAADHGDRFHGIHAVSRAGISMRVLDLKIPVVRDAVLAAKPPPIELYLSDIAIEYNPS